MQLNDEDRQNLPTWKKRSNSPTHSGDFACQIINSSLNAIANDLRLDCLPMLLYKYIRTKINVVML